MECVCREKINDEKKTSLIDNVAAKKVTAKTSSGRKERAKLFLQEFGNAEPDSPSNKALSCCCNYAVKPLIWIIWAYVQIAERLYAVYLLLPMDYLKMIFGIGLCFFGGVYFTSIAAIEAFRNFGGTALWEDLKLMWKQGQLAVEAIDKDTNKKKDEDLKPRDLILQKAKVGMAAITEPELLVKGMQHCLTVYLSVLAVLKFQFASTIALCLGIADLLEMPMVFVLGPCLSYALGKEREQWVQPIIGTTLKALGAIVACFVQAFISMFYSGIRGATLFAEGFINILGQKGIMDKMPDWMITKPFDADKSWWDEAIGYTVAAIGMYCQVSSGFGLPFLVKYVALLPLTLLEGILRWSVFVVP